MILTMSFFAISYFSHSVFCCWSRTLSTPTMQAWLSFLFLWNFDDAKLEFHLENP